MGQQPSAPILLESRALNRQHSLAQGRSLPPPKSVRSQEPKPLDFQLAGLQLRQLAQELWRGREMLASGAGTNGVDRSGSAKLLEKVVSSSSARKTEVSACRIGASAV